MRDAAAQTQFVGPAQVMKTCAAALQSQLTGSSGSRSPSRVAVVALNGVYSKRRGYRHATPLDPALATDVAVQDECVRRPERQRELLRAKACACG